MQTITIHDTKSITIRESEFFPDDEEGKAFNTRRIEIEDESGNIIQIILFANEGANLTIKSN